MTVLVLAVIAGLPHGAFDVYIARRLGLWETPWQLGGWLLHYVLLSSIVIAFWVFAPMASLLLFLLISALHFGRDSFPDNPVLATSLGLLILGLPMLAHSETVTLIFSYLFLSEQHAAQLVGLFSMFALCSLGLLLAAALLSSVRHRLSGVTGNWKLCPEQSRVHYGVFLLTLVAMAFVFHPLIYFALYFSLSHSPLHLRKQWRAITPTERKGALGILILLTSIPIGVASIFATAMEGAWSERLIAMVFIGLAALTMPHMLLLEKLYRAERKRHG